MLGSFERWPLVNPLLGDHGGSPADSPILCVFNACSRRARQRRRHAPRICAALVGELHAARSRGTPTLPALELRLPNEKGNLSGETTIYCML